MLITRSEARTARLLYIEIFWSAILGGIVTFNAAYLLRLGASNFDISLLSALPCLVAAVISVPAGYFLQSRAHPGRWTLACLAAYWTGYLLLAFVPGVRLNGLASGTLAVLILTAATLPAQVFTVGIFPLLAEMIPNHQRVHVFAVRAVINACMGSVVTFATGQWLSRAAFPGNYQVAYVVCWLAGMASVTMLVIASRALPRRPVPPVAAATKLPPRVWRLWPADLAHQRDYVRIVINTFLHSLPIWLATPLYILFFVRQLGADDAWLGLFGTVTGLTTIVGLLFWRAVARRIDVARTLRLTIISIGVMPLLVGLIPNLTVILFLTAFNGFFTGGITVSHINVLLMTLPEDRRPEFMGLYSALLNLGAFGAPLLSVALAGRWGLGPTLVVCGVVGLLGGASHWIWRVPGVPPARAPQPEAEGA